MKREAREAKRDENQKITTCLIKKKRSYKRDVKRRYRHIINNDARSSQPMAVSQKMAKITSRKKISNRLKIRKK